MVYYRLLQQQQCCSGGIEEVEDRCRCVAERYEGAWVSAASRARKRNKILRRASLWLVDAPVGQGGEGVTVTSVVVCEQYREQDATGGRVDVDGVGGSAGEREEEYVGWWW